MSEEPVTQIEIVVVANGWMARKNGASEYMGTTRYGDTYVFQDPIKLAMWVGSTLAPLIDWDAARERMYK